MQRLFFLLALIFTHALPAQLAEANAALTTGDTRQQIATLDSLVAHGETSPTIYQALGNAHFNAGDFGRAILNYERGLRLHPGNKALTNNLKFVRAEAGINRLELKGFFLKRWWESLGAFLGAGLTFWLAMACWWLAVAGAVVWYLRRQRMAEKSRFALLPSAGLFLVLAVLFFNLGKARNARLENDREAILMQNATDLRVAPGPEATLEESLSAGLKLRILDEFDGYVKIALDDGKQGWVPADAVERI